MADYLPQASGLWSTTTWITAFSNLTAFAGGNTPPMVIDDVYADGKTITVDINTAVNTIRTTTTPRTGGLAGGGFRIDNNISLSANCLAGTTTCLTFLSSSPNTATLVGSVTGSASTNSAHGVSNNSTGILNIFGDCRGGGASNSSYGIANVSTGILNITGNVFAGTNTNCFGILNNSTGTINVTGNVFGVGTGSNTSGGISNGSGITNVLGNVTSANTGTIQNSGIINGSGTVNVIGNVAASTVGSCFGINNASTGVVNVTGTVISGGGTQSGNAGIANSGAGAITTVVGSVSGGNSITANINAGITNGGPNSVLRVVGNVFGGGPTNGLNIGIANTATTSTTFITGNIFGGIGSNLIGVLNNSTGSVFINGTAFGGIGGSAVSNSSTGLVYVTKVVGNAFGLGSVGITSGTVGIASGQNSRSYIEQVEFGIRGQTPVSGPVYILPSNRNTLVGYTTALGNTVTFYNSLSVDGLLPPTSSVQLGTVYNVGNSVGTMAVPSASAVEFGVPIDNTVGIAALTPQTVWGYSRLSATDVGSMGDRLRNAATAQSVGSQIASFNL
jgi:hypothetical protein